VDKRGSRGIRDISKKHRASLAYAARQAAYIRRKSIAAPAGFRAHPAAPTGERPR
jgi:hypothetical protein